ncbi:sensor histidine kinase [Yoonia sp.]|uniref:sensor histidine kinase n=1 Tax=Yoonia sp. TaxID=2212373 RepID=UPI0023B6E1AD
MRSLQASALTAGAFWGAFTIILCAVALLSYLGKQSEDRFQRLVEARHTQVAAAVANYNKEPDFLATAISNPVYQRPFSGRYWQVTAPDGTLYLSPSLVDETLPAVTGRAEGDGKEIITGPAGQRVLRIAHVMTFDNGAQWLVEAASSLEDLDRETETIRSSLLTALAIVFVIGTVGCVMLVRGMIQPLERLRKDVAARWMQEDGLDESAYPVEVVPLVADINTLLRGNRDILRRARRQAADLAHAVRTPSAIMRNELAQLHASGADVTEAVNSLDRLDAQLQRAFARVRADGAGAGSAAFADVTEILRRLDRAFTALARNADKRLEAAIAPGLRLRMDSSDLEEALGNLLDNALKYAHKCIQISAWQDDDKALMVRISDDGPGIDPDDLARALDSGQRLDTRQSGTGLGLAIATDLVQAYGGSITLARSDTLGGLSVTVRLPPAVAPALAADQFGSAVAAQ